MRARRWIRLDLGIFESAWLEELSDSAQLAWVKLLIYVKAEGVAGTAKALTPSSASRRWRCPESVVATMCDAAQRDGALRVENGDWIVENWEKYQIERTSTERSRRYRQDASRLSPAKDRDEPTKSQASQVAANTQDGPSRRTPSQAVAERPHDDVQRSATAASVAATPDVDVEVDVDVERTSTSPPTPHDQERGDVRSRSLNGNGDGHGERPKLTDLVPALEKPTRKAPEPTDPVLRWEPLARENLRTIRGTSDDRDVVIDGHRVGMGLEVTRFRRLVVERKIDPEMLARAIAYLPDVSELQAPMGLALFESVPELLEECVGRVFRSMPPAPLAPEVGEALRGARRRAASESERIVPIGEARAQIEARRQQQKALAARLIEEERAAAAEKAAPEPQPAATP